MTQKLIANMLRVRRESATDAVEKFKKLGIIKYPHGEIAVLNRPHLELQGCKCYAVVE